MIAFGVLYCDIVILLCYVLFWMHCVAVILLLLEFAPVDVAEDDVDVDTSGIHVFL